MGKTNSAPMRPLSSEDGMGADKGISSFVDSFISEIEAVEIFSWSTKPKAHSKVSRREEVLQPARQFLFFLNPHTLIWQLFPPNEWLVYQCQALKGRQLKSIGENLG